MITQNINGIKPMDNNHWYQKDNFYICFIHDIPRFSMMIWDKRDYFEYLATMKENNDYENQIRYVAPTLTQAKQGAAEAALSLLEHKMINIKSYIQQSIHQ